MVFFIWFLITQFFHFGSSTIGFSTQFYTKHIYCIGFFVWISMVFSLFLPVIDRFWQFFWVRFFLDHFSASGVVPLYSAQDFASETSVISVY